MTMSHDVYTRYRRRGLLDDVAEALVQKVATADRYLGSGRHRSVYKLNPGWVLKIPHHQEGLDANYHEVRRYHRYLKDDSYYPVAPCRVWRGLVVMREVKIIRDGWYDPRCKSWAGEVDCAQVGELPDGRIVAYDMGSN